MSVILAVTSVCVVVTMAAHLSHTPAPSNRSAATSLGLCSPRDKASERLFLMSKDVKIPPAHASLNLSGVHLKVALWSCNRDKDGKIDEQFTLTSRILTELSTFMHFTYTVTARCYGFDGIVAGMAAGEIDVAAYLRITEYRQRFVSFLHPLAESRYSFLVRLERVKDLSPLTILAPFHSSTWISLLGYVMASITTLTFLEMYRRKREGMEHRAWLQSFDRYVMFKIGSVLQQGGTYNAVDTPSRMLVGWWWLFVLVITATYSATLVTHHSIHTINPYPFTSLQEASTSPLTPLVYRNNSDAQLLSTSDPESDLGRLCRRVVDDGGFVDSKEEAYERVLSGRYSFINDEAISIQFFATDYMQHGYCRYTLVPHVYFYPGHRGLAVPKHFPYTEQLTYGILTLHERGFIKEWSRNALPEGADQCLVFPPPVVGAKSFSFEDMHSLLLLLAGGLGGATVCLLLELAVGRARLHDAIADTGGATDTENMLDIGGAVALPRAVREDSGSTLYLAVVVHR
ncbi:PREDICTED: glutamate receptor ionotropic, delta-2-like [Priapulus caudatus]|uniref:Glutamate receptor ionotropic, delta-2-like n=1 Tax=Priapulus caudatus TaxID=37621 RepID=A0ABM1F0U8_PRICU|nr:PREDICTED: glutamate receptor ionotropic, delta-2-like [Priapulus caudatus]